MASHLPMMNWYEPDLSETTSLFRQKMWLYLDDEEIEDVVKRARKICCDIGDEGLRQGCQLWDFGWSETLKY